VRQQLGRAADVFAVTRVLDQALDLDGDGLFHLVRDDLARQRTARLLGFFVHFLAPASAFWRITVFTRAMFLLDLPKSDGFTVWPLAACMRRLKPSRRSLSRSSFRAPASFSRRPSVYLRSLAVISAPDV